MSRLKVTHPTICISPEIYKAGTTFLSLIVWVFLHSLLHSERRQTDMV